MELGAAEEGQPPQLGALPANERKSCSPLPLAAVHPMSNTQVGQFHGWVSPRSGVPPCPPLDSQPGIPQGTGSLAQQGLPQLAPCPGQCLSVRLGREDEESVFLLADPLHELVDSTDGASLGPQGTVAYVELEGAGYLGEEGHMLGTCLCPTWGWHRIFPPQATANRRRGSGAGTCGGSRVP